MTTTLVRSWPRMPRAPARLPRAWSRAPPARPGSRPAPRSRQAPGRRRIGRSRRRGAVVGAEALRADRCDRPPMLAKPWLSSSTMVSLIALLDRGDDLRRHHQVRAVADHHVDLARRIGHLDAEAPGDLVAHARVAVLEVVAVGLARAPELVQVAGQAAGGADHDVLAAARCS